MAAQELSMVENAAPQFMLDLLRRNNRLGGAADAGGFQRSSGAHPILPGSPVAAATGHSPATLRVAKRAIRRGRDAVQSSAAT